MIKPLWPVQFRYFFHLLFNMVQLVVDWTGETRLRPLFFLPWPKLLLLLHSSFVVLTGVRYDGTATHPRCFTRTHSALVEKGRIHNYSTPWNEHATALWGEWTEQMSILFFESALWYFVVSQYCERKRKRTPHLHYSAGACEVIHIISAHAKFQVENRIGSVSIFVLENKCKNRFIVSFRSFFHFLVGNTSVFEITFEVWIKPIQTFWFDEPLTNTTINELPNFRWKQSSVKSSCYLFRPNYRVRVRSHAGTWNIFGIIFLIPVATLSFFFMPPLKTKKNST